MTQYLVKILREKSDQTLREVLTLVSYDIYNSCLVLHERSRAYRKALDVYNRRLVLNGKGPVPGEQFEMYNFYDPEFSSFLPLDMDRLFNP
ncbi:hypothetical protein GALMADRAFT_1242667 [Galerina marginata CBS 339.88]|uniref:Uncharacterized protein n=1 Tax=Galerina marginata (strain CBS 339.88) TaxID=685588 RepID=A0A067TKL6_GALM3|nr:hypothetical protein GALMADRAFT_1242667 [Galerina marginata CBS 339.88]